MIAMVDAQAWEVMVPHADNEQASEREYIAGSVLGGAAAHPPLAKFSQFGQELGQRWVGRGP